MKIGLIWDLSGLSDPHLAGEAKAVLGWITGVDPPESSSPLVARFVSGFQDPLVWAVGSAVLSLVAPNSTCAAGARGHQLSQKRNTYLQTIP